MNQLKLSTNDLGSNLNEVLAELKIIETSYYRSKVVSISEAVLENPNDTIYQSELKSSLQRLGMLLSA